MSCLSLENSCTSLLFRKGNTCRFPWGMGRKPNNKCLLQEWCVSRKCFQPYALTFPLLFLSFKEQFIKLLSGGKKANKPGFSPAFALFCSQQCLSSPFHLAAYGQILFYCWGRIMFGMKVRIYDSVVKVTRCNTPCVRITVPRGDRTDLYLIKNRCSF